MEDTFDAVHVLPMWPDTAEHLPAAGPRIHAEAPVFSKQSRRLATLMRMLRVRPAPTDDGNVLILAEDGLWTALGGILLRRRLRRQGVRARLLLHLRWFAPHEHRERHAYGGIMNWVSARLIARADKVAFNSQWLADQYRQWNPDLFAPDDGVLVQAVHRDFAAPRRRSPGHDLVTVTAFNLKDKVRGLDLIADALVNVPGDWTWHIYGDGPLRDACQERVQGRLGDRAVFHGSVDRAQVIDALDQAAFLVHASFLDAHPRAVLEALSRGTPCVVARGSGAPQEVERTGAGLVADADPESLAQALRRGLENPTPLRRAAEQVDARTYQHEGFLDRLRDHWPGTRIAWYAPGSDALLRGGSQLQVGGVEVQAAQWIDHLSAHAPLTVLTYDGGPAITTPRGHVVGVVATGGGRTSAIRRALRKARAHVVVERMPTWETLYVGLAARLTGTKFVFHWSGDHNASVLASRLRPPVLGPLGFQVGRRLAHYQITQTDWQTKRAGRRATKVPDLVEELDWQRAEGDKVLWLGTLKPDYKQPHLFLDLAARLPHRQFLMAGRMEGPDHWRHQMQARIRKSPNVAWLGPVQRSEIPGLLASARVLVNTSSTEGFSITFLEAAASGLPVVSLSHDPDGVLAGGMGLACGGDPRAMADAVETMFTDARDAYVAGCHGVAESHAAKSAVPAMLGVLYNVVDPRRRSD